MLRCNGFVWCTSRLVAARAELGAQISAAAGALAVCSVQHDLPVLARPIAALAALFAPFDLRGLPLVVESGEQSFRQHVTGRLSQLNRKQPVSYLDRRGA